MKDKGRLAIVIIVFLAVLALALNQAAWAGPSEKPPASAPLAGNPAPQGEEDPKGTVRPPGCGGLTVRVSGDYSICGFAVLHVTMNQDNIALTFVREKRNATPMGLRHILVDVVRMFIRIDNKPYDGALGDKASVQICYAVAPNAQVQIMYRGIKGTDEWTALQTTVADGQACATADLPGYYALVAK